MIHGRTFYTQDMSKSARLCVSSGRAHGIESFVATSREDLEQTEFYRQNKQILDEPKGAGYWLFKPWLVDRTLKRMLDGQFLVYADAGIEFIDNVRYVIDRMQGPSADIWLFGNNYEHEHWCKRDVIDAVSEFTPWLRFGKQCQASVIFVKNTERSRKFVSEWLRYCCMPNPNVPGAYLIDDTPSYFPNHSEFREHRHDQAILTTLVYREGIPLHAWCASYNNGAFLYDRSHYPEDDEIPTLFNHHRGAPDGRA